MGALVDRYAPERRDLGVGPFRVIARGLLDMTAGAGAGAWIGIHPGFTAVITNGGAGIKTVHLSNAGAATMYGRGTVLTTQHVAHCHVLAGATLQDMPVNALTDAGGAADAVVLLEVIDTTV